MIWHPRTITWLLWGIGFALIDQVFYHLFTSLPFWLSALSVLLINLVFVVLVVALLLGLHMFYYFVWHGLRWHIRRRDRGLLGF